MTSAHDGVQPHTVIYTADSDGLKPSPLPTGIVDELLPLSSPSTDATSTQPSSAVATTSAAATATPSPTPSAASRVPATVHQVREVTAGSQSAGKAGPPGAAELGPQSLSTGGVTAKAASGWTPAKQLIAYELAAVIFVAVLAMILLSRRGTRPAVSRNSGIVVLGDDNQLDGPRPSTDGGYADGFADARTDLPA